MQLKTEFELEDEVVATLGGGRITGIVSGAYVDHGGVYVRVEYFDGDLCKRMEWFREAQVSKVEKE